MAVMKKAHKDDAVSPVVGVMLMLVVTIVIAAVIAAFSSGLTASQEEGPVAAFSVEMSAANVPNTNDDYYVQLQLLAGDSLKTSELKIDTSYKVPATFNGVTVTHAGKIIDHTIDGSLEHVEGNYLDTTLTDYPFIHQRNSVKESLQATYLQASAVNNMYTIDKLTLKAGDKIRMSKLEFLGFDTDDKTNYGFNEGSIVHVTITHIPSNKVLFDKDVVATW